MWDEVRVGKLQWIDYDEVARLEIGLGLVMYDFLRKRRSLGIEPGSVRILIRRLGSLDQ